MNPSFDNETMDTENIQLNSYAIKKIQYFIEKNKEDLEYIYDIFQYNFSSNITFEDFCNFCYIKTFFHIL